MLEPAPKSKYLETPEQWKRCLDYLMSGKVPHVGMDSETLGCNPEEDTAVDMAKICLWSLAVPHGPLSPRGFMRSLGFVLPPEALDFFAPFFASDVLKVFHNKRYDKHAFLNEGFELTNTVDTVDVFRVVDPGHESYGAKAIATRVLFYETYGAFSTVFTEAKTRERRKKIKEKVCARHGVADGLGYKYCESCDEPLTLVQREEVTYETLKSRRKVYLQEILQIPPWQTEKRLVVRPWEHPMFELLVDYAGLDSIITSDAWQVRAQMINSMRKAKIPEFAL